MTQNYDVAGLGNAIVDVIASTDDQFLLEHNIAKGVMSLIDHYRAQQLLQVLPGGRELAGGSAANTMAGLASFGGRGVFMGKVRDDRLGQSFARGLEAMGIDFPTRRASAGPQTACCLIAVTPDGQRSMNTYLGACRELREEDIDEAAIAASTVLYVEGYLWDEPAAKAAIEKAMRIAKGNGRKVAFTLSDPFCVERWRSEFIALLKDQIDILFANEAEAMALFETEDFDGVFQSLRSFPGIAALTRSERGCVVAAGQEVHVLDAHKVPRVLDTTGAGDQFAAGFLFGYARGRPLPDCGRLGTLAASEVITHYGARPEKSLRALAMAAELL
ncbi:MAG: adenosine kinase [Alphaproteobacteria bacterium]|nr:adenosine kinase [Alphaproteobacteria bacterium]